MAFQKAKARKVKKLSSKQSPTDLLREACLARPGRPFKPLFKPP